MGTYIDFDEYLTCLRKHGITPPPIARAAPGPVPVPSTASGLLSGAVSSLASLATPSAKGVVAAAATKASALRAAL